MSNENLERIRNNYLCLYRCFPETGPDLDELSGETLLELVTSAGAFREVDYADESRGSGWAAFSHLSRLCVLCEHYIGASREPVDKETLRNVILRGLDYWLQHDFANGNWWYNQVGVPRRIAFVLMLMREELSTGRLSRALKVVERYKLQYETHAVIGQNLSWLAELQMLHGLIADDETIFAAGRTIFLEALSVQDYSDGIQSDQCFHQHGPMVQFGNYGLQFAENMVRWAYTLRGTRWAFPKDRLAILTSYLAHGLSWILWRERLDPSACGRQLFPDSLRRKARVLKQILSLVDETLPSQADWTHAQTSGSRYFWRSDYLIYRTNDFFLSVKMSSGRVVGAETCNGESIKSKHQGDGVTILMQHGAEYKNIFPLWNWRQLPGITAIQDDSPLLMGPVNSPKNFLNRSDYAGGLAAGPYSVASFSLDQANLKANKSYFCFPEGILCLGSDISSASPARVTTTLNQALLKGPVWVGDRNGERALEPGKHRFSALSYVHHDRTLYLLLSEQAVELSTVPVTGAWSSIFTEYSSVPITKPIFKLLVNHGEKPCHGTYAYAILPDVEQADIARKTAGLPVSIVANSAAVHAVFDHSQQCCLASFFRPGQIEIDGICQLTVSAPCIVTVKCENDHLLLRVCDPTQKQTSVQIEISGRCFGGRARVSPARQTTILECRFPEQANAGQAISFSLKKPELAHKPATAPR
jgi:chondroitin AC lyase